MLEPLDLHFGATERRLGEETQRLAAQARSLDEDVSLALDQGKLELARFATRRLLGRRKDLAQLEAQSLQVTRTREALAERLEAQEREFEDLRQRVRQRLASAAREDASESWLGEPPVADEEVELELLRRARARVGGVE